MPLLDAAFAIAILAVATAVTTIVGLLPELFVNCAAEFDRMLPELGDGELIKIIARVFQNPTKDVEAESDQAIRGIKTAVDGTHLSWS